MAEIVNLRRVKKARQRTEQAVQAAANRAAHGRTKAEREGAAMERARRDRVLDGAGLDEGTPRGR